MVLRNAENDVIGGSVGNNGVRARGIRRCGELLKTFQTGPQGGRAEENTILEDRVISQRQAVNQAGVCLGCRAHRQWPLDDFEQLAEASDLCAAEPLSGFVFVLE